jgi:hypothetical protein
MADHQSQGTSSTIRRRQPGGGSGAENFVFTPQEDEIIAENKRRIQHQAQLDAQQVAAAKRSFYWSILIVGAVALLFFGLKFYGFLEEPPIRQNTAKAPKWSSR